MVVKKIIGILQIDDKGCSITSQRLGSISISRDEISKFETVLEEKQIAAIDKQRYPKKENNKEAIAVGKEEKKLLLTICAVVQCCESLVK